MHVPIKVDYAVRALVDLAQQPEARPIRATDIATRTTIPEPYLAQVLHALSKRGLVRSVRGPQGGHTLGMDPSEIRLSMVMACLGGSDTPVRCLDDISMCIHVPSCAQREVWRAVDTAVFNILNSTTVADLVARTREIRAASSQANPSKEPKPVAV